MRVLRFLLAVLVAAVALAAGFVFFAAVVVVGLAAFLVQLFWRRSRAGRSPGGAGPAPVRPAAAGEDVIDIHATEVPPDLPPGRPDGPA